MERALSARPPAGWPFFQARPSTRRAFLPSSATIDQSPTTARKRVGSAPSFSLDRSMLTALGAGAAAGGLTGGWAAGLAALKEVAKEKTRTAVRTDFCMRISCGG